MSSLDPNEISLGEKATTAHKRYIVYQLLVVAKIIRRNVLQIAPDMGDKKFVAFCNGPNDHTKAILAMAAKSLPQSIGKTVVSEVGQLQVEGKDNINLSPLFEAIFNQTGDAKPMALDFFSRNLTTAKFNEKPVFLIQPFLFVRYDFKNRDAFFNRARFVWLNCVFLRLPSLLPVIAGQIVLYSIRLLQSINANTRTEDLEFLSMVVDFLPGLAKVAKPPQNVSFSKHYKNMHSHRRQAIDSILEDIGRGDRPLELFVPPYSMYNFDCKTELEEFLREECKYCENMETMQIENERSRGRRSQKKTETYDGEADLDEDDQELLQRVGYQIGGVDGAEDQIEEIEEEVIEEDVEMGGEVEEMTAEREASGEERMEEDAGPLKKRKKMRRSSKKTMASPPAVSSLGAQVQQLIDLQRNVEYAHLLAKRGEAPDDSRMESVKKRGEKEKPPPMVQSDSRRDYSDMPHLDLYSMEEDAINEAAINDLIGPIPDAWEMEGYGEEADVDMTLSTQDIIRAQELWQWNESSQPQQPMNRPINLDIPLTPGRRSSYSSGSLPSPSWKSREERGEEGEGEEEGGNISPPIRSDDMGEGEERMVKAKEVTSASPLVESAACSYSEWVSLADHSQSCLPSANVPRAPVKTFVVAEEDMEKEKDDDTIPNEDDVDWIGTKIVDEDDIVFLGEKEGVNGGRGPMRRVIKREPLHSSPIQSVVKSEPEMTPRCWQQQPPFTNGGPVEVITLEID